MNALMVLSALLAAACAAPSYNYGRAHGHHGNHYNGMRQAYVNSLAERLGAGTGTAFKDGVPGTDVGHGHGAAHGYGHGYGRDPGYGFTDYHDRYNAVRQEHVNAHARAVGAGTGTFREDGVPGTFLDRNHQYGHVF